MISKNQIWRQCMLPSESKISDAIRTLVDVGLQIILVTDANGRLLGTVCDGDIRRGLLKGLQLSDSVESIVQTKPLVVPETFSREQVLQLMAMNKIHQIPIVDSRKQVLGIHLWNEMNATQERDNIMIIMAGGKGTRMRPYTEACPKPMLNIGGKPMLEHIITRAKADGFTRFLISIYYFGHMIREYFGNGESLGVSISYMVEKSPLGTAGALSLIEQIPSQPVVVTNGDVITDINYAELLEFHDRHESTGTMAVRLHEWQHPFGVVQMEGVDIKGIEEKPVFRSHVNAGVYALSSQAFGFLQKGEACDMPTLFDRIQHANMRTVAYPMHEPWLDVGRPEDLTMANMQYKIKAGN